MEHKIKRKDGFLNFDNSSSIKTISSKESKLQLQLRNKQIVPFGTQNQKERWIFNKI